jgi:NAD+ synthase (glutamine-hydrolysing)
MKIAAAQITTDPGRFRENTAKIIASIEQARAKGAALVVFPELTIPGYGHMDLALREEFIAQNREALDQVAAAARGITAIVGFIDQDCSRRGPAGRPLLYNSAAVIHDARVVAVRDKTLLPAYDIFYEGRYFSPGREQGLVDIQGVKTGIGICEDLWDEGYARKVYPQLVADGAELLVNISASPFHPGKTAERERTILRAMSGKKLPFVYVNLAGTFDGYDGEIVFDGQSLVYGCNARLSGIGKGFGEDLFVIDIAQAGRMELPEAPPAEELYHALVQGIRDYFRRSGFERAYIGLSGGIDSSLVAALAAAALGKERVVGVTMPSHITSAETKDDALLLARNLGIRCDIRPIAEEYRAWERSFASAQGQAPQSLTKQNKQARIRGSILMEYTNEDRRGLVISTGNKTELALGYCTLYGDMCGGFAAISDLSKERVYAVADFINTRAGADLIPASVVRRVPTAELEVGQTDAGSLPADYPILSPLVDDIVDNQLSREELCRKYEARVVDQTLRLVHNNEFKRRQAAPGIRVTPKAFGIGRRYPIAHGFR